MAKTTVDDLPFLHSQSLAKVGLPTHMQGRVGVVFQGVQYRVNLTWMRKGKGWALAFECPLTRRKVQRLYPAAGMLVSRHALGLPYASQVRGRFDVLDAQAQRLRHSLHDPLLGLPLWLEGGAVPLPTKPKAMRPATYWAKLERLERLQRQLVAWIGY